MGTKTLKTCADVYSLPYYWETNELRGYIFGFYYNHFRELDIQDYNLNDDLIKLNNRVSIRVHMHYFRDFRRFWRLASVWYTDKDGTKYPFMVVLNAGREGDDFAVRIISDTILFLEAENYLLNTFKNSIELEDFIKEDMPNEIEKISTTIEDSEEYILNGKSVQKKDEDTIILGLTQEVTVKEAVWWSSSEGTHYTDTSIGDFYEQEYYATFNGDYDDYYKDSGGHIVTSEVEVDI